ncbi:MAG: class I SAM-dependent methyltransferase [Pseudomonadales bacterium]|nr:class I SAM-dependent methyltransferase [Pseudomonadales bacterium]
MSSDLSKIPTEGQADYESIFHTRGSAYDNAMHQFPNARDQEFQQVIDRARIRDNCAIIDVPAGGQYLKGHLPESCNYQPHEPCSTFTGSDIASQLLPLPFSNKSADIAISLAGVHHIEDKEPLFKDIFRVIKPQGQFILSDVTHDSPVAHFLDEYVGKHNSTGHNGIYLDENTASEIQQAGWSIQSKEQVNYHWKFDNKEDMAQFCNTLFDLRNTSIKQTINAIDDYLKIDTLPKDRIGMRWSLMTICALKL